MAQLRVASVNNSTRVKTSIPTAFPRRWSDVQCDGTLESIDLGIDGMIELVKVFVNRQCNGRSEECLDDLEAATYATTRELRKSMALVPGRVAALTFDPACLLRAIVGQYFPFLPSRTQQAITDGAHVAQSCTNGLLSMDQLSPLETGYRTWMFPHLLRHLGLY